MSKKYDYYEPAKNDKRRFKPLLQNTKKEIVQARADSKEKVEVVFDETDDYGQTIRYALKFTAEDLWRLAAKKTYSALMEWE